LGRRALIATVLKAIAVAADAWVIVGESSPVFAQTKSDIRVDSVVLGELSTRLRMARDLFDQLPDYGVRESRARLRACSIDSGELFQPYADRVWRIDSPKEARRVKSALVKRLARSGWTRDGRDRYSSVQYRLDGSEPDLFATAGILFEGAFRGTNDVYLEAHEPATAPCHLADGTQ
jgi:hypothetical protein